MPTLIDRKRAELQAKLDSLASDFTHWRDLTQVGVEDSLALHYRQIERLIGDPDGELEKLRLALVTPVKDLDSQTTNVVLQKAPVLEKTVLAAHALWSFFRDKFAQRFDSRARTFLDAVSELSWACYKPARDAAGSTQEQPLIYLSANWSPFMLGHGKRWSASDVGNFADEDRFAKVLDSLPLSVISVPMVEMGYVPDGIFVAHETGHAVEQDFKLGDELKAAVKAVVPTKQQKKWSDWCSEMFADAWAVAHVGSAYVGALQDFIAPTAASTGSDRYPPERVRARLNREMLRVLGLKAQAENCERAWIDAGLNDDASDWDDQLPSIAAVLLTTSLTGLGNRSAMDVATDVQVRQDAAENQAASSAQELTEDDPRVLFAALRLCHEANASALAGSSGAQLMKRFLTKMQPSADTRRRVQAGSRSVSKPERGRRRGTHAPVAAESELFKALMAISEATTKPSPPTKTKSKKKTARKLPRS